MPPAASFGQGPQGVQPRQFVHIRDAVHAILRACFLPEAKNETFNVAGPDVVTYREMGKFTRIQLGLATREDQTPDTERLWRRYQQQYDMKRARDRMGFRPAVHFVEGLREIVEHHRQNGAYADLPKVAGQPAGRGFERMTKFSNYLIISQDCYAAPVRRDIILRNTSRT